MDVAYDRNGNPTLADDQVHLDRFDARWTIDEVDRLTRTEQGDWSGSGFNSLSQDELWDYTPVGGWDLHKLDIDGNGSFTNYAGGDLQDRGTLNTANELTERDIDDDSTTDFTLAYDDLGNLTDDGEFYKYVYDPFGRLRKILKRSNDALVAEYRYNGLGYLIAIHEDTDGDGDVDGDDAWRRLVYDHRWRVVAEHQDAETTPRLFYVHHAAGLDGRGTGSYIDQVICRERRVVIPEGAVEPSGEGGNSFNERLYYCQNWRADVVAIVDSSGRQVEQARYSAYGVPFGLPAGDADSNGAVDFFDYLAIYNWIGASTYDVRGDLDLDGDVDAADASLANGMMGTTLGRGVLSRDSMGNRFGYAGYFYHGTVLKYHVRNRVYDPYSARWLTRDPIGYDAGTMNLYEYVASRALYWVDPLGLSAILPTVFQSGPPARTRAPYVIVPGESVNDLLKKQEKALQDQRRSRILNSSIDAMDCCFTIKQGMQDATDGSFKSGWDELLRRTKDGVTDIGGAYAMAGLACGITGYTRHGLNQAISRNNGRGVCPEAILDAVKCPQKIVPSRGGATKYVGKNATVVLNKDGKVITVYGRPRQQID